MKFDTHEQLYACKLCCDFRVKIMCNVRATFLDIAIPLKFKTANNIEHDYNLLLGIKSIAISLKAQVLPVALIGNNASLSEWPWSM